MDFRNLDGSPVRPSVAALGSVLLVPALEAWRARGGVKVQETKVIQPCCFGLRTSRFSFISGSRGRGGGRIGSGPEPGPVGSVSGGPLGASLSVCALVSDNNPNHFSPMLSPPARSGRYTTSAVFAS